MNTEDNEMIQTPWGKKRWRTIREAFEQRDEMIRLLREFPEFPDDWDLHNADAVEAFSDSVKRWKRNAVLSAFNAA